MMRQFIVPLAALWMAAVAPGYGEDSRANTLSIQGEGVVYLQGTIADVSVGIEVVEKTSRKAQELLSTKQAAVLKALRDAGADQVETRNFSLYPQYNTKNNNNEIIGYTAHSTVAFSCPVDKAGGLIDIAVKAGANQNEGVSVRASDDELNAANIEALNKAAQKALTDGKAMLDSLSLTLKGIQQIDVGGNTPNYTPVYRSFAHKDVSAEAYAPVEVTEQKLTVRGQVTLILEYREKL